jgi:hypothetical protein
MGFWGTFIVARSDHALMDLEPLKASAEDAMWQRRGEDGWQVVQIHRGPEGWDSRSLPAGWERLLVLTMERTGHPVLAAVVLDSDGAQLIGFSPEAGRWGGWLMLGRIIGHIDSNALPAVSEDGHGRMQADEGEDDQCRLRRVQDRLFADVGPPAYRAAPLAVRWANEAGFAPTVRAVEAALDGVEAFAEDVFFQLLDVLGLPGLAGAAS